MAAELDVARGGTGPAAPPAPPANLVDAAQDVLAPRDQTVVHDSGAGDVPLGGTLSEKLEWVRTNKLAGTRPVYASSSGADTPGSSMRPATAGSTTSSSAGSQPRWVQPSGPRKPGEGTEAEEQGIISIENTPPGAVTIRITLLAAGFIIGPAGSTVREIMRVTGVDIKSWTDSTGSRTPVPRSAKRMCRVFVLEGEDESVVGAIDIITAAVDRYKELCEGRCQGQSVPRQQRVLGVDFSYQPPPRSVVPFAASLKGNIVRPNNKLPDLGVNGRPGGLLPLLPGYIMPMTSTFLPPGSPAGSLPFPMYMPQLGLGGGYGESDLHSPDAGGADVYGAHSSVGGAGGALLDPHTGMAGMARGGATSVGGMPWTAMPSLPNPYAPHPYPGTHMDPASVMAYISLLMPPSPARGFSGGGAEQMAMNLGGGGMPGSMPAFSMGPMPAGSPAMGPLGHGLPGFSLAGGPPAGSPPGLYAFPAGTGMAMSMPPPAGAEEAPAYGLHAHARPGPGLASGGPSMEMPGGGGAAGAGGSSGGGDGAGAMAGAAAPAVLSGVLPAMAMPAPAPFAGAFGCWYPPSPMAMPMGMAAVPAPFKPTIAPGSVPPTILPMHSGPSPRKPSFSGTSSQDVRVSGGDGSGNLPSPSRLNPMAPAWASPSNSGAPPPAPGHGPGPAPTAEKVSAASHAASSAVAAAVNHAARVGAGAVPASAPAAPTTLTIPGSETPSAASSNGGSASLLKINEGAEVPTAAVAALALGKTPKRPSVGGVAHAGSGGPLASPAAGTGTPSTMPNSAPRTAGRAEHAGALSRVMSNGAMGGGTPGEPTSPTLVSSEDPLISPSRFSKGARMQRPRAGDAPAGPTVQGAGVHVAEVGL